MWKRILFGRTGGHWLFYISAIYLVIGLWAVFNNVDWIWLQPLWILFLSMPLWFPPLGRAINLDVTWDQKMFNLFGKKDNKSNVVKFPDHREYGVDDKQALPLPQVQPPKKEEPAKIFYRLGLTDNNRVAFSMGYSEITMSADGCQQMIDQLTFFKSQLYDEDGDGPDGDGGKPIPLPEEDIEAKAKKAA